jgi:hypothetical protein
MKKDNNANTFKVFKIVFIQIIVACPVYFVLYCASDVFQGVSYGINTLLMQRFFDSLTFAVQHSDNYSRVFFYAGVTSFIVIFPQVL